MIDWTIFTPEFPPNKGGVGNLAFTFARALSQYAPVDIFTNQKNIYPENEKIRVTYIAFSRIWPHWLPLVRFVLRQRKKIKNNRILCLAILPFGTVCYILNKLIQIPYVTYVHGMDLAIHKNNYWKKFLISRILKNSLLVLCNSNYTKSLALYMGASNAKTAICHPAAHITPETASKAPHNQMSDLLSGNPFFLTVGRLVKRKNFPRLIEAFSKIQKKYPNTKLVIVGNGQELATIQKTIKKHSLDREILVMTDCTDEEVSWYYQHAYAICFIPTSRNGDVEGFGITAVEGGAFGKPIIASNQGGVSDAVSHNQTGICVNPESVDEIAAAMEDLLANQELAKKIGLEGKKRYESFFSFRAFAKRANDFLFSNYLPNISVIIPVYNNASTITDCLNSIYHQTLQPKEIIVVDDGSTDDSHERITQSKVPCSYTKISHSGAPSARNTGAQKATGDYLLFLDADALCSPYMLEYMLRALITHPEVSYAYSAFKLGRKKFTSYEYDKELLKKFNYIHTSSLIKRSVSAKFDETLKRHQDWDLWLTLAENGYSGVRIPQVLYRLQKKRGNISRWIPAFVYKIPGSQFLPAVKKYQAHADIIKTKHHLT